MADLVLVNDLQDVLNRFLLRKPEYTVRRAGLVERMGEYAKLMGAGWDYNRISRSMGVEKRSLHRYAARLNSGELSYPTSLELAVWEVPLNAGSSRMVALRRAEFYGYTVVVQIGGLLATVVRQPDLGGDNRVWVSEDGRRWAVLDCLLAYDPDNPPD